MLKNEINLCIFFLGFIGDDEEFVTNVEDGDIGSWI